MRGRNRWWILWLAAVLLLAPACTENDLDDSDSDVVLEVVTSSTPPVTGEVQLGSCSLSGNECLTSDNCPEGETCILPPPGSSECLIAEWNFNLANQPLSEGAIESPYNDIVMNRVEIDYNWSDGSTATTVIGLGGVTVPANGTASVTFYPIAQENFLFDDTTVALDMNFVGQTIAGQDVARSAAAELFIEDCQ
jgi:hypothetical protein